MRCLSNHSHTSELSRRLCDGQLRQRVQQDRAARPAQYQPIDPSIPATPRWLDRAGKDLTGNVRSN